MRDRRKSQLLQNHALWTDIQSRLPLTTTTENNENEENEESKPTIEFRDTEPTHHIIPSAPGELKMYWEHVQTQSRLEREAEATLATLAFLKTENSLSCVSASTSALAHNIECNPKPRQPSASSIKRRHEEELPRRWCSKKKKLVSEKESKKIIPAPVTQWKTLPSFWKDCRQTPRAWRCIACTFVNTSTSSGGSVCQMCLAPEKTTTRVIEILDDDDD